MISLRLMLGGVLCLGLCFGVNPAWAADTAAAGSSIPAQFGIKPPQELDAMKYQQMAQMFGPCSDMASAVQDGVSLLGDLVSGKGVTNAATASSIAGGAASGGWIGSACPGSIAIPDTASIQCGMPAELELLSKAYTDKLAESIAILDCKNRQTEKLMTQVGCLTEQTKYLNQALTSLQAPVAANLQQQEKDVAQITSMEEDRITQLKEAMARVAGNKENGAEGVDTIIKDLEAAQAAFRGETAQIRTAQAAVETRQKMLQQAKPRVVSARARACFFDEPAANMHCDTAQTDKVTVLQHVTCLYEQKNLPRDATGKVENKKSLVDKVTSAKNSLDDMFNRMNAMMPTQKELPESPEEMKAFQRDKKGIVSLKDFEAKVSANLPSLGAMTPQVKDVVIRRMRACFSDAAKAVAADADQAGATSDTTKSQVSTGKDTNQDMIGNLLEKYSALWNRGMRAMTGSAHPNTTTPANVTACVPDKKNVALLSPAAQLSCANDFQRNLRMLLDSQSATVGVSARLVAPKNPTLTETYTCYSLIGCKKVLEGRMTYLNEQSQKLGKYKADYKTQANHGVFNFTSQMAAMLRPQNQLLIDRVKLLSKQLQSLKPGSRGVPIKFREAESFEPGENGIYKVPKKMSNIVAGMMEPGLLDTEGDLFSEAIAGIGEAKADFEKDRQSLDNAKIALNAKIQGCRLQAAKAAAEQLRSAVDSVGAGNCAYLQDLCDGGASSLDGAVAAVGKIQEGPGVDQSQISSMSGALRGGIKACKDKTGDMDNLNEKTKTKTREVEALNKAVQGLSDGLIGKKQKAEASKKRYELAAKKTPLDPGFQAVKDAADSDAAAVAADETLLNKKMEVKTSYDTALDAIEKDKRAITDKPAVNCNAVSTNIQRAADRVTGLQSDAAAAGGAL
ncbi:hypothetical protein WDW86_08140 [Bdellovibrionota bacterium FG-2]